MMDQDAQSVDREVKFEDWRFDGISQKYHMKELKKLLSSDPVLKKIKPKLTGLLREPISALKPTPNVLEALRRLMNLLKEAGFTAETLNAQTLPECNQDRVIAAGPSLLKTLSPLLDIRDPGDNPTSPIGTKDQRITPQVTMDQVLTPINDSPKGEHTGSSRYTSVDSEVDSNDSSEIQRMSLRPRGADLLRKKFGKNDAEVHAERPPVTQFMNMVESDQPNFYFRAAMKKYELEQAVGASGDRLFTHPNQKLKC